MLALVLNKKFSGIDLSFSKSRIMVEFRQEDMILIDLYNKEEYIKTLKCVWTEINDQLYFTDENYNEYIITKKFSVFLTETITELWLTIDSIDYYLYENKLILKMII